MKQEQQKQQTYQQTFAKLVCPITLILIKDPVTAADNIVYQRINIHKWLTRSNLSPVTGKILPHRILLDNKQIKQEIKQFKLKYNIPSSSQEVQIDLDYIISQRMRQLKCTITSQSKKQQEVLPNSKNGHIQSANTKILQKQIQNALLTLRSQNQQLKRQITVLNQKVNSMDSSAADYLISNLKSLKKNVLFQKHLNINSFQICINQPQILCLKMETQNQQMQKQKSNILPLQTIQQDSVVSLTQYNQKNQQGKSKNQEKPKIQQIIEQKVLNEPKQVDKLLLNQVCNNQPPEQQKSQLKTPECYVNKTIIVYKNITPSKQCKQKQEKSPRTKKISVIQKKQGTPSINDLWKSKLQPEKQQVEEIVANTNFQFQKQQQEFKQKAKIRRQKKQQLDKYFSNDKFKVQPTIFPYYVGQQINGKKQHYGKLWVKNNQQSFTYEGQFKDDFRQGFGKLEYSHGDKYIGQFKNGARQGFGKYYYKRQPFKGDNYQGYWINNDRSGYGKQLLHKQEQIYEGYWKNDLRYGKGRIFYKNNGIYQGKFQQSKKHGQGILKYPDGKIQQQYWVKGQLKNGQKKLKVQ